MLDHETITPSHPQLEYIDFSVERIIAALTLSTPSDNDDYVPSNDSIGTSNSTASVNSGISLSIMKFNSSTQINQLALGNDSGAVDLGIGFLEMQIDVRDIYYVFDTDIINHHDQQASLAQW